jgi:hypothetical protein
MPKAAARGRENRLGIESRNLSGSTQDERARRAPALQSIGMKILIMKTLLWMQDIFGIYSGLVKDGAKRSLGHVSRMVWNCCPISSHGIHPDFVAPLRIAVEFEPVEFESPYDLAILETR